FVVRAFFLAAIAVAAFWLIMSLAIAHYIYDRTSIYDGDWIARELRVSPKRWASFHAGLDEFGPLLQKTFPQAEGSVVDFYDANERSEEHTSELQSHSDLVCRL